MERWYLYYYYKGLQVLENGQSTCLKVYVVIEVIPIMGNVAKLKYYLFDKSLGRYGKWSR